MITFFFCFFFLKFNLLYFPFLSHHEFDSLKVFPLITIFLINCLINKNTFFTFSDLVKRLEEVRTENGSIEEIGKILTDWIPTLRPYIPYCANQLQMKTMLLHKTKENKHFSDFLQVSHSNWFVHTKLKLIKLWSYHW